MPAVKWCKPKAPPTPPVKADYLGDLISRHMRERKVTYAALGPKVGLTKASAACKKHYGVDGFKVEDLFQWCRALEVAPDALAEAVKLAYQAK